MKRIFILLTVVLIGFSFSLCGCQSFREKRQKEAEEAAERRERFETLGRAIENGKVEQGMPAEDIKETYGPPESTFSSGSTSSRLRVWVYGKSIARDDPEFWKPIRLYFNNGRLVDWNY